MVTDVAERLPGTEGFIICRGLTELVTNDKWETVMYFAGEVEI